MQNIVYYTPTRVVFGKGAESQVGELIRRQNCKKVLIHYGGGSVERSGLLGRVRDSLKAAGVCWTELGGVVPNPHLSLVYEGIKLCREEHVDFILAVGGGSVIDSAKAIGCGVAAEGDVWDFYEEIRRPEACLPVGSVLTIAAAGSEMSKSSVITKEDGGIKRGCSSDVMRPVFAIMNPELTMTLPAYQTACGCVDILMHTMERYLSRGYNMELTDAIAEALMKTVLRNAEILIKEPNHYEARAEIMWAGSLSHNGLTGFGTDGGDWATHQLEHELGGMFDVAHGAGLAALWGTWARYVWRECPDRFLKFSLHVMEVEPGTSQEETIERGITAMEEFYRRMNMPTNLRELGIHPTEEQFRELAEKCSAASHNRLGTVKVLTREDMEAVYRAAL